MTTLLVSAYIEFQRALRSDFNTYVQIFFVPNLSTNITEFGTNNWPPFPFKFYIVD